MPRPLTGLLSAAAQRARLRDEAGATLIIVMIWMTALLLMLAFVVDVGNWYVHQRHLQSQADSAALAAAGSFSGSSCSNATVTQTARQYGGDPSAAGYNAQTSSGTVKVLVNSSNYYDQGGSDYSDPSGAPCSAMYIDTKVSEQNLPLFFGGLLPGLAVTEHAHARVNLFADNHLGKSLPIAVENTVPQLVQAQFYDETPATPTLIATATLTADGSANGYLIYDNTLAPVTVPVTAQVGVRIMQSGGVNSSCGQSLVQCTDDVLFIHGTPQSTNISAGDVTFSGGSCADPYHDYLSASCTVNMAATLNFTNSTGASAVAHLNGANYTMTCSGNNCSATALTVPADSGPLAASIDWSQTKGSVNGTTCTNPKPCTGTIANVQRVFAGGTASSDNIRVAQLVNPANGNSGYESMTTANHSLVVKIGIQAAVSPATAASSPTVTLRISNGKNASIDCDPAIPTTRQELIAGCAPQYTVNTGTDCTTWNTSAPQPWPCVKLKPGEAVGQIQQGMTTRVNGGCNNWASFPNISANDTRWVNVFIVPFGGLSTSAGSNLPVQGFATYYVTGWGSATSATCSSTPDDVTSKGWIVGHFYKYIKTLNQYGGTGASACQLNTLNNCVAVLTQ